MADSANHHMPLISRVQTQTKLGISRPSFMYRSNGWQKEEKRKNTHMGILWLYELCALARPFAYSCVWVCECVCVYPNHFVMCDKRVRHKRCGHVNSTVCTHFTLYIVQYHFEPCVFSWQTLTHAHTHAPHPLGTLNENKFAFIFRFVRIYTGTCYRVLGCRCMSSNERTIQCVRECVCGCSYTFTCAQFTYVATAAAAAAAGPCVYVYVLCVG